MLQTGSIAEAVNVLLITTGALGNEFQAFTTLIRMMMPVEKFGNQ